MHDHPTETRLHQAALGSGKEAVCEEITGYGIGTVERGGGMTPQDFSTYCQASYSLWYSDGLSQFDVDRLPLNSRFHALYAPAYNAPRWHVVLFEIKTMPKIVGKGTYRAYVAIETVNLEYAPFDWQPIVVPYELPKEELQADTSAAWLDYIDTGNVSPEIEAVLPTLGSYEATKAIETLESIEEMVA